MHYLVKGISEDRKTGTDRAEILSSADSLRAEFSARRISCTAAGLLERRNKAFTANGTTTRLETARCIHGNCH